MVEPVETPLYRWPVTAKFGRSVPKTKFYEHASISSSVKDKFVADVRRITWAYKLAESTTNLQGSAEVPEIQVFEIEAKNADVAETVLTAIDQAVRTQIVFEISRREGDGEVVRMVATHKQLGTGTPKLGPYFTTAWQPTSADRVPLPTAIDLVGLYTALLDRLAPVASRPGENVADVVGRLAKVRALEREIASLERRLRNERQLNRKVELRRLLQQKQTARATLV